MANDMEQFWDIMPPGDTAAVAHLCDVLHIEESIATLLVQRGISNYEEAKAFFRPRLEQLHDPFRMKDMRNAVERLDKAIQHQENILVYGDYDVDGTTAVALVYAFLKDRILQMANPPHLFYYIPDRYHEGYGMSFEGVDYAGTNGCSLIIALDCGIKDNDEVAYAAQKGIDCIICDHHLPGKDLPEAAAVLDPQRNDCSYPCEALSGCGIGFKLLQGYLAYKGWSFQLLQPYLYLVAVSIGADIVPITDENRILTYYGITELNNQPDKGMQAIINKAGIEHKTIEVEDIVFRIGPRINAAGRIKSGSTAVKLLVSDDWELAQEISKEIDSCNAERKNLDQEITEEARSWIENDASLQLAKSTVLYKDTWHKGVIGIVASRLIEAYYRPTIIFTKSNGYVTGSGRSVDGFDLYAALHECSDLLENYGGHYHAAGLTLKEKHVPAFKQRFEEQVRQSLSDEMLKPRIVVDEELDLSQITPKFYRIIRQFEPCGPGNMAPVFCTRGVTDKGTARVVGSNGDHLQMRVYSTKRPDISFKAIAFRQGHQLAAIQQSSAFDICYTVDLNHYQGQSHIQLNIKDIKVS